MTYEHYSFLADLFDFPGVEFVARAKELCGMLDERYPNATADLRRFIDGLPGDVIHQQELYTRTFDVQAITTIDIGYVLFGDDYKRAELLSNLTREHRESGNECRGELADHLANILRLLPRLGDAELRVDLVTEIVVPALMLMIREFDPERIAKKNVNYVTHYKTLIETPAGGDPRNYAWALNVLLKVLEKDFNVTDLMGKLAEWQQRPRSSDFLGSIEREMQIEDTANPTNSGCDS